MQSIQYREYLAPQANVPEVSPTTAKVQPSVDVAALLAFFLGLVRAKTLPLWHFHFATDWDKLFKRLAEYKPSFKAFTDMFVDTADYALASMGLWLRCRSTPQSDGQFVETWSLKQCRYDADSHVVAYTEWFGDEQSILKLLQFRLPQCGNCKSILDVCPNIVVVFPTVRLEATDTEHGRLYVDTVMLGLSKFYVLGTLETHGTKEPEWARTRVRSKVAEALRVREPLVYDQQYKGKFPEFNVYADSPFTDWSAPPLADMVPYFDSLLSSPM